MLILGIDTSCDDTSASLLEFRDHEARIVRNVVSNQTEIHHKYGGIVPELASRTHVEMIWPVVEEALEGADPARLGAIAVCHGPGLIGSLLVGCCFAKSMSYVHNVPLVGINHLEGHMLSAFLSDTRPEFPFISLVVSGGHTCLYLVRDFCDYEELGSTLDDAAGEAYDKVSKMLGLGYPGGPAIDRKAAEGDPEAIRFPRAYLKDTLDFSFSGLKNAVRIELMKAPRPSDEDVAASFQASVVDVLIRKCERAMKLTERRLAVTGGVAANSSLRGRLTALSKKKRFSLYLAPIEFCTDNAAMIAYAGYHRLMRGETADLALNPKAYLPLVAPKS